MITDTQYGNGKFADRLTARMVFSQQNLATDSVSGEMHLIMCRNVLIYFAPELQEQVVNLFRSSVGRRGFLLLGVKESLQRLEASESFEPFSAPTRLYRAI